MDLADVAPYAFLVIEQGYFLISLYHRKKGKTITANLYFHTKTQLAVVLIYILRLIKSRFFESDKRNDNGSHIEDLAKDASDGRHGDQRVIKQPQR